MKILIIGGTGYVGSHIAVELAAAGHDVIIADNFINSSPVVAQRLELITGKAFPVYKVDVTDAAALDVVFSENRIDSVIHCAGLKAVGESVAMPLSYYRNNIDSTLTLLEVMAKHGVNKLIFSSSATVYGIPESLPFVENMKTGPINPYGWTKLMIEQIITDAVTAGKLSAVILRYFNPVGAHQSGLIGEMPNGIPNNLMPYISQVAVGTLPRLNVYGNDYPTKDGTGVRDYIHVVDLAKGHVAAVEYGMEHSGAEIFNLGTGVGYSVLDIVRAFEQANSIEIPYTITKRRDGDIAEFYSDASKVYAAMGWQAELSLADMCRDAWNWQKNNPKGYEE